MLAIEVAKPERVIVTNKINKIIAKKSERYLLKKLSKVWGVG